MLILFTFYSCAPIKTEPKELYCPVPIQNCSPTQWKGLALDTSKKIADFLGYYYSVKKVENLDTEIGELQVAFNSNSPIISYSKNNIQYIKNARYVNPHHISPTDSIEIDIKGQYGSCSIYKNTIAIAIVTANQNEKLHLSKLRVPENEAIGISRIYIGELSGNKISNLKMLYTPDTLDNDVWEAHPAFSSDGSTLFFASNRSKGIGGVDIWYRKMQNGSWTNPINCGDSINTQCDELSPYIAPDNKHLYFSSMGHQSVGGFDIFSASIDFSNMKFTETKNVRFPINTTADELFPTCYENCDSILFYSSNQNTPYVNNAVMSDLNIYVREKNFVKRIDKGTQSQVKDIEIKAEEPVVEYVPEVKEPIVEFKEEKKIDSVPKLTPVSQSFTLTGTIVNQETQLPVYNATISAKNQDTKVIEKQVITDHSGTYSMELLKGAEIEVVTQAENLFYDSFVFKVEKTDTISVINRKIELPVILTLRINFPYDEYMEPYKLTLDSNGNETKTTWQNELDNLAENLNKTLDKIDKILLAGHTDDQASVDYNKKLGKNRVDFVIKELVKRGVPKKILFPRSAGKLEPLPKREGEEIETYRKRLRRVTMEKILK